ncbi:TetR/AcrR family transcriptional regulator [Streptomyces sp. NPDC004752]
MPVQPSQKASVEVSGKAPDDPSRELRSDARRNRDRILAAAREAFAARGIDVPVTTIARRAGVGVATLYRRFPTRASLVTQAFAEEIAVCATVLDEALEDPDPWHGFCTVIQKVSAMQARDRGFTAAFLSQFPDNPDYARELTRTARNLARLIQRAKDAGRLRDDFDITDIPLLLRAVGGLTDCSPEVSAPAARRLVAYLLHSFRADTADHAGPPLPPPAPLGLEQIYQPPG